MKAVVVLSFVFAVSLCAADPAEAVREAAASWTQAVVNRDKASLDRLLAADLYFAHSNGRSVQNKAEYIAWITTSRAGYEALKMRDVAIHVYGGTAVLAAYI